MLSLSRTIYNTSRTSLRLSSTVSAMVSSPAPPQFQSTPTVWPLPLPTAPNSAKPTTEAAVPSKSKNRNKRKKAAKTSSDGAPPRPPAPSSESAAQHSHSNRTNFPWRGSGRGRGRGGGASATPGTAAHTSTRPFSTAAKSSTTSKAGDEAGVRAQRTPLFPSAQAGPSRRQASTNASSTAPASDSNFATQSTARRGGGGGGGQGRGGGGRGRGRGKARGPPGGDRGRTLLDQVRSKAGEEDLEAQIHALYDIQRPSPESIAAREHLITELTDYLNRERFHWGHPHSPTAMPLSIEPFGSIRFGLGTSTSDLDLCLLDPYRPNGFEDKWYSSRKEHMQDLPDIYQMRKMGNSLYRAGLENIHPIPDAAVPICKFEVQIDGQTIQADLNTNERLGVYNSRLLNSYCNLHPLVRPLSVFVKFWASQRGLNNPSGDRDGIVTFSSYTLILLIISYLQKIKLLPNLQDEELVASTGTERNRFFSTPKAYSRRGKLKHLIRSVGWDVTFVEYDCAPDGFEQRPTTLVELARGFFDHFGAGSTEFDPARDVVSIANGAPFARERAFGQFPPPSRPHVGRDDDGSNAERVRQEMEDLALEAFADELSRTEAPRATEGQGGGGGATQVDDPRAELDAVSQAQAQSEQATESGSTLEARPPPPPATAPRARSAAAHSRSSSPIPYGDFSEPEKWTEHLLVVQDPFILTRNCAGNVRPDWVEELRIQMRRARDLIDANAPLSTICLHHYDDADFVPVAVERQRARQAQLEERRSRQQQPQRQEQPPPTPTPRVEAAMDEKEFRDDDDDHVENREEAKKPQEDEDDDARAEPVPAVPTPTPTPSTAEAKAEAEAEVGFETRQEGDRRDDEQEVPGRVGDETRLRDTKEPGDGDDDDGDDRHSV